MGRILAGFAAALVVVLAVGVIYVHDRVTSLEAERVTEDVHAVRGSAAMWACCAPAREPSSSTP